MRLTSIFAAALAGLSLTSGLAEAQRGDRQSPTITLFDQPNYQGQSVVIDTDVANLSWVNFNDRASSYRISGGQWEICVHADYRGSCQVVDSDAANMTGWAFNNQMSSVRPVHDEGRRGRIRENGITLWSGANFTGRSITLIDPETNLNRLNFNDAARSIEVHSGRWTVCQHASYGGRCREVTRDVRNLAQLGLDREISSVTDVRPEPDYGAPGYGAPGYDRPGYGGRTNIDGGVRGVETLFFPVPEVRGYPVARCLDARGGGCDQIAANALCRASGYGRAAYFNTRRNGGPLWFLDERQAFSGRAQLTDVLCVR